MRAWLDLAPHAQSGAEATVLQTLARGPGAPSKVAKRLECARFTAAVDRPPASVRATHRQAVGVAAGGRLQRAMIRNGYLWTCQHVGLDNVNGTYGGDETGSTVNRSGVQWWKLQLNGTGTPLTYAASGIVNKEVGS